MNRNKFINFMLSDVFTIYSPKVRFNANTVDFGGKYPYVARGSSSNGIRGYITENEAYLNPAKSLSFGQDTATVFYQPKAYFTGDKIKIMILKHHELNEKLALYFITAIKKAFSGFSWGQSSFNENIIKKTTITIPVIVSANPNYNYTVNDIDWQYMEERITELEQECITELDAYLKVTGLNDYELTEDDKETLSLSAKFTSNKTDGLGIDSKNGKVIFKEFRVIDVFDVRNTKNFMQSQIKLGSGHVPYLTASETNNSVASYISCDKAWLERGNCIFIGGKTLTITYQEQDFVSNDSHNLALYLKNDSVKTRYIHEYLITSLKKSLAHKYFWGDSISFKKIQSDTIKLPVDRFGEINFDYMERYIKAIEKLTIAEVVKYKDKVISATKQLVLNN